jgi:uncharacterized protein
MSETSRRNFLLSGLALPVVFQSKEPFNLQLQLADKPKSMFRTLGKTGLKPTSVAFGCMLTSDPSVIEKAADLGINYFDTARVYSNGNNERMVGAALKAKRKNVILSTKTMSKTKTQALEHINTSLKELGTDYVDIWHLHMKNSPEELTDDLLEAQQIAKKEGKVRFLGVSTHEMPKIIDAVIKKKSHFDVILTMYNHASPQNLGPAIETAAKEGLGVIAMKVMSGGMGMGGGYGQRGGASAPRKEGAALAALKWVLKNQSVSTAIPSITNMEQLEENMKAISESFSDSDQKILTARLNEIRPIYCRTCGSCSGKCPQGIPVADVLRYLSYAEGYGEFQLGRENFLSLPADIRNVRCADCSGCTIQCPNGVRVVERLQTAQELFA